MAEPIVIGDANDGRNRRVLVLGGLAAALILAVVVLPGVLFSDGGEDDFEFPPVAVGATPTTVPGDVPTETFESFSNKNPFTPLVDVNPAPSDGGPSVPGQSSPTTTAAPSSGEFTFPEGPSPTFPPGDGGFDDGAFDDGSAEPTTTTTTTTTTAPAPPPPPPREPDRVSLLEVFTDQTGRVVASVRVNDTTHQVGEGDEFATSYRVLDLDVQTRCGEFLFGDDRFGLCEGDETSK